MAYFYNLKNILDPPKNKMEGKIFIGYLKVIQTFLRCLDSFVPLILKQKKKKNILMIKGEFLKEMEIDVMIWPTKFLAI